MIWLLDPEVITALMSALTAVGGAASGLKFVGEGERGIVLRFNKAVRRRDGRLKVAGPGLRILFPGVHKLARQHVRQRTVNLPNQTITLADSTAFDASAVILCRVRDTSNDLYASLFENTDLDTALTNAGLMVVRDALSTKRYSDVLGNQRAQLAIELLGGLQGYADSWGVEVLRFELSDFRPTPETARMIQTDAQTRHRTAALIAAASTLGYTSVRAMPPAVAAALIGIPVVTSVDSSNRTPTEEKNDPEDDEDE